MTSIIALIGPLWANYGLTVDAAKRQEPQARPR